ncbi:helix-turn-helix domain-containing protein [Paracoccus sp. M683]|uniref:winged helix-turn-helix transcriptional regulator n=1 Tax=Paracoccus sp. M683 TaxID=2594268 RepID=UPI002107DADB|nr:winged helix-turn-helix transcriptional regulator [Paracoccus sp. M683]
MAINEVPPRVEYALTDLGRSIMGPIRALTQWADSHHDAVLAARRDYAAREG